MKINKKYIAFSGIAVLVIAAGVFWYTDKATAPTVPAPQAASTTTSSPQTESVTISIDGLYQAKPVVITNGQTALSLLQTLTATDPRVQLATKVYAGMGTLITGLNGMNNGTGKKYWQYKVNSVTPQIGADQYKLKNGDSVDWFFGASQE